MAVDSLNLKPFDKQIQSLLQEEYSFYQTLYILLDKQRDFIKYEKDDHLLDLYAEIERCQKRIKDSEDKITALRQHDPTRFSSILENVDIKKLVNSIATLLKKNIEIINDNDEIVRARHARIKHELDDLRQSAKIMQYLGAAEPTAQFLDGKT